MVNKDLPRDKVKQGYVYMKNRKIILTYICTILVVGLQIVASITNTNADTAIIVIATLLCSYTTANVIQKIFTKNI